MRSWRRLIVTIRQRGGGRIGAWRLAVLGTAVAVTTAVVVLVPWVGVIFGLPAVWSAIIGRTAGGLLFAVAAFVPF